MTQMKKILAYVTMFMAAWAVASCQSDDMGGEAAAEPITVKLSLGAAPNAASTRAWADANAADGEMMKSWFVVAVQGGKVAAIAESAYADGEKETDDASMELSTGQTTFYSFANLSKADVGLQGIKVGDALPDDFDSRTYVLAGNKDGLAAFGGGIPMTGKQTVNLTEAYRYGAKAVELEVVRLVAKAEVKLSNITQADLKVKSISIDDITADGNSTALFPSLDVNGNVKPSLADDATRSLRTYAFAEAQTVAPGSNAPVVATFYLNESTASTPHYFVLSVMMADGGVQRFAMLTWNAISRNDYLVIPVSLNDYKVTVDAEQFTAIGVVPDVVEADGKLTVTFHNYGEFHLRPRVTRLSDNKELTFDTECTMGKWETLEQYPAAADEAIYDVAPAYNAATHLVEGYMGWREGYAIHQMAVSIGSVTIPYKVEIRMKK